jgi:hypothetical protein
MFEVIQMISKTATEKKRSLVGERTTTTATDTTL